MKKAFYLFSALICIVFIVLQVIILNFDSTSGREFDKITQNLKKLEFTNSLLSQKVASASSLVSISDKAKLMGFNSANSTISLYSPQPLAQAQNTL